ncbi:hypothetical protein HZA73_03855 [candidate division TA06 bacterium]|nr:hypothetical protein [candidate division TA06 bacterium]
MNGQTKIYLCIREVGTEYLLQPTNKDQNTSFAGTEDNIWYFITTRPLASFKYLGSFGSYRDLQAAFSAMVLLYPLLQKTDANNLL